MAVVSIISIVIATLRTNACYIYMYIRIYSHMRTYMSICMFFYDASG